MGDRIDWRVDSRAGALALGTSYLLSASSVANELFAVTICASALSFVYLMRVIFDLFMD
jgi:hypothetical protein